MSVNTYMLFIFQAFASCRLFVLTAKVPTRVSLFFTVSCYLRFVTQNLIKELNSHNEMTGHNINNLVNILDHGTGWLLNCSDALFNNNLGLGAAYDTCYYGKTLSSCVLIMLVVFLQVDQHFHYLDIQGIESRKPNQVCVMESFSSMYHSLPYVWQMFTKSAIYRKIWFVWFICWQMLHLL